MKKISNHDICLNDFLSTVKHYGRSVRNKLVARVVDGSMEHDQRYREPGSNPPLIRCLV